MPDVVTRSTLKQYRHSTAVTELKQFEGRGHSLTIDSGSMEVAHAVLDWLQDQRAVGVGSGRDAVLGGVLRPRGRGLAGGLPLELQQRPHPVGHDVRRRGEGQQVGARAAELLGLLEDVDEVPGERADAARHGVDDAVDDVLARARGRSRAPTPGSR